ncbi:hypothetical protein BS47DRAFT_1287649, partial [Hydnum rufescens UP504]
AHKWNTIVLPSLLRPYLALRAATNSGRDAVQTPTEIVPCTCGTCLRLEVTCVHFKYMDSIVLYSRQCTPAPQQLVERGLFPCAPFLPKLAINLDMLEFAAGLFVNSSPNETAWAATLTEFLDTRGYVFATEDSFRRCFGNALTQYQVLMQVVEAEVTKSVEVAWTLVLTTSASMLLHRLKAELPLVDGSTSLFERNYLNSQSDDGHLPQSKSGEPRQCPSAYLHSQCPLCFGGRPSVPQENTPHVIVCIDANFQQKRNHDKDCRKGHEKEEGMRDPPLFSPCTVRVSEADLKDWEVKVEGIRNHQSTTRTGSKCKAGEMVESDLSIVDAEDRCEPGMPIPNSCADSCGESFIAADSNRVKASTMYFSNTGMMAMLCRHDIVLFWANMWTAGEKQFFALALLAALMAELPLDWTIGFLYDIACQMHRSLIKWGFLPQFLPRLLFAILVFHAYGHQWVCQLWYHPRKAGIWGLSDGEGCERFWSMLRRLIPGMRVTGYHHRLFVLDLQIAHIHRAQFAGLGEWLRRRITKTTKRLADASPKLEACGHPPDFLRQQFTQQRTHQSRPLTRQSRNSGIKAIEKIVALRESASTIKAAIEKLESELTKYILTDSIAASSTRFDVLTSIEAKTRVLSRLHRDIDSATNQLNLYDKTSAARLNKIKREPFFALQMNMRAVKARLCTKLRERKFELANLERAYRSKQMAHIEDAMHRREPTITVLAKKYNDMLKQMVRLRATDAVATNAVLPPAIILKTLFKLDVDDDTWHNIGLEDLEEFDGILPPWLGDDTVRAGIRFDQEVMNCEGELLRCRLEHEAMRDWFQEEYEATILAEKYTPGE